MLPGFPKDLAMTQITMNFKIICYRHNYARAINSSYINRTQLNEIKIALTNNKTAFKFCFVTLPQRVFDLTLC